MKSLIQASKKILIILPQDMTFDTVAAALGVAEVLRSSGKDIKFGSERGIPEEFLQVLDFSCYETINKISPREVILSLNQISGGIKDVRWRRDQEKIQFILTPGANDFKFQDVDFEIRGSDFDLVISLGCKTFESAGSIYKSNPELFKKIKVLNIDIGADNSGYGIVNKIGSNQFLSDWVFELISQEEIALNQKAVESLLKGILYANNGFQDNQALEKVLQKFVSIGGRLCSAASQLFDTLTVAEMRYIGKIISNVQVNSNGIIRSKVRNSEFQGVRLDRIIYPEVNIIARVKGYKSTLFLSEYKKDRVSVYLSTRDKNINLLQGFSDYFPVGNSETIKFDACCDLDQLEAECLKRLSRGKSVKSEEKQEVISKNQKVKKEDKSHKEEKKTFSPIKKPLAKADSLPTAIEYPATVPSRPTPRFQRPASFPPQPLTPVQRTNGVV